jgi:hypothetical protein
MMMMMMMMMVVVMMMMTMMMIVVVTMTVMTMMVMMMVMMMMMMMLMIMMSTHQLLVVPVLDHVVDVVVDLHLDRVAPDSTHEMHKITVSANERSLEESSGASEGSLGLSYKAADHG